ncbi:hypothetical protein NLJ89_g7034 [Agrocybe chaxingu]|uniref:Uncharacterized protein n=1 Tax=Agrocybe chaxingu TaxID=84603 RepID=A0A9W8JZT6_9AGAR|nr:hypothetical protein NLJ89_g7034 [Agrocybe chaxingu]
MLTVFIAILKDHTRDDETDSALASLGSYLTVLDNYDRLQRAAADRGHGSGGTVDAGTREHMDDGDPLDRTSTPSSIESGTRKRSRSLDSEDGDLGRHDGRRRIDPNVFPWNIQEELSPSALAPDLRQTLVALENFSRDLKLAKSSLLNSARCPQFPDGEWTNLLAGRVVDLDHVLSGVYSIDSDSRKRERLGSLEVIVGGGNPLRTIRTHSDWVIAWDVFVQAVLYVFPHRSNELTAYGKFIRQLFTSVPVERHARVIQFDRAARLRAASRRDLLLSDHHQFTDLNVLWIQNAGGGVFGSDDRNRKGGGELPEMEVDGRPVADGMKVDAPTAPQSATTRTSARKAGVRGISSAAAPPLRVANKRQSRLPIWSARPSFARTFIWNDNDGPRLTLAISSLFMPALPPVPDNELANEPALDTIAHNPDLFQVVTPISVSNLRDLLVNHPNNLFIDSVCHGLLHGFWPWADTSCFNLPFILDVKDTVSDPVHLHFAYEQHDVEVSLGCFSQPFLRLLPGMLAVPFNVATKPHSDKLRLCFNHSAQPFSRNEMIPKELVSVPLDNLQDLGRALREVRVAGGSSTRLVVWKFHSRVSNDILRTTHMTSPFCHIQ